jgi:hypothetical protein
MKEVQDIRKDAQSGITIAPADDESNLSHLSIIHPIRFIPQSLPI